MTRLSILLVAVLLLVPCLFAQDDGKDVTQVGRKLVVEEGEIVRDAICIGCPIDVHGTVERDAVSIGSTLTVYSNGFVRRDAATAGGDIVLQQGATVDRDAVAVGGHVRNDPASHVGREIISRPYIRGFGLYGIAGLLVIFLVPFSIFNIVMALIACAIMGRQRVEVEVTTLRMQPLMAILGGMAALVGAVILCFICSLMGPTAAVIIMSVVGAILFVLMVAGYAGVSSWLGHGLSLRGTVAALVLGAVIISVLQLIPIFGVALFVVFVLLAIGSAGVSGFGTTTDWLSRGSTPPAQGSRPASAA